ncbi:MAG: threonine--tRNA ligase [Rickettsiales bacterium]|nr:threonine--tRNA ligase [Rickettsiales bacterium]
MVDSKNNVDLAVMRHSASHVMAQALKGLYPGAKLAIGPAIDNGFYYDIDLDAKISPDDFPKIENKMREIIAKDYRIERSEMPVAEAVALFRKLDEPYKVEMIRDLENEGAKTVTVYTQGGFSDLCKGPHLASTGLLAKDGFKLASVAGAYWRGDSKNRMLQRIYAAAWPSKKELDDYLRQVEEAEKRDHRKIGAAMDLFHFEPEYAPGAAFWHPLGWTLLQTMVSYLRRRQEAAGYVEVSTPHIMNRALWETSGHWEKYRENMYVAKVEGEDADYAVKPMNCPGGILIYKHGVKSYRDLPIRMAEFGTVDRFESSGSLMGLLRTREFMQDDAHIYCAPDQLEDECLGVIRLIMDIYKDFGFADVKIKLSTRPEKRLGSDDLWDASEGALANALDRGGYGYEIFPGEGAFYGPKLEFSLRDAIGREWQAGTLQLDMNLPGRFDMCYVGRDGAKHAPVMLHRALFGGIGRFIGVLLENTAGRLPLWLSPRQAAVLTVSEASDAYAAKVADALKAAGLRVALDDSNEKIGYKIRLHSAAKVPVLLLIGDREREAGTVTARYLGSDSQETLPLGKLAEKLKAEAAAPR